jgi:hypothetical protein
VNWFAGCCVLECFEFGILSFYRNIKNYGWLPIIKMNNQYVIYSSFNIVFMYNYGSILLYLKRFVDLIVSEKSLILIY